jgi:D-alanyl-D-alanine carboxypeptidase (penicillin-binding protein 5/6)
MVINGLTSMAEREKESLRILGLAFREFRSIALFEKGDVVAEAEVFGGVRRSVPLIVNQRVAMSMRRAARDQLRAVVKYDGPLNAPVARGQKIGLVTVSAPGAKTITAPVYAGAGVQRVGIWGSMGLAVRGLIDQTGVE